MDLGLNVLDWNGRDRGTDRKKMLSEDDRNMATSCC